MDVRAVLRQGVDGRWTAQTEGAPDARASGSSRERCLAGLHRAIDRAAAPSKSRETITLVVRELPQLAGVAEAAEITGWDKRRVITYIDRGTFPEPLQTLASGRVWLREDVEAFATEWRAKQAQRRRRR